MNNFEEACKISCEEWVNSFHIPENYVYNSKKMTKYINGLAKKIWNGKYHRITKNTIRFIIVAAIILSLTATVFAVPVSRDFIISTFADHSIYSIASFEKSKKVNSLSIEYVPEGFTQSDIIESSEYISKTYINQDLYFTVTKYNIKTDISFDTEEYTYKEINANGITYVIYSSNDTVTGIIWNDNAYSFVIYGNCDESELLTIAEHIK